MLIRISPEKEDGLSAQTDGGRRRLDGHVGRRHMDVPTREDAGTGRRIRFGAVARKAGGSAESPVTLPVEFNASRRAKKMLVEEGILTEEEVPAASKVLSAAALTYVASLLVSLLYFLRFALVFASLVRKD